MDAAEFDFVVIGAGSAGACLAARLGEDRTSNICVIEAGGGDSHLSIHVPAFVAAAISREKTNWRFSTVLQPGMAGRTIPVPRGKVLGGSGSINGMVYFRGHPRDFDDWADMGCTGWSYAEVLPYFTRTERNEIYPQSVFHGTDGPIGVGQVDEPNYHDHVASPIHMETDDITSYGISWRAMPRNIAQAVRYLLARTGPLGGNVFESVAFLRTDPSLAKPDVQFVFQPAKRLTVKGVPFPVGHGFAISPVALYPESRGTIRLASADPEAAPLIDPKLLAVESDIAPLVRALKIARAAFGSAAFDRYKAREVAPGLDVATDNELADYIRETAYTVHHPVGSCRMGDPRDPMTVVDPQLRLTGVAGLRVADASVMPNVIGGNTNAPTVMIGERCADFVLGKPALPAAQLPPESVARRPLRAEEKPMDRLITVSATGYAYAEPDRATISAGVAAEADTAAAALSANTELMQKVVDGLKESGIDVQSDAWNALIAPAGRSAAA
ncbi:MAG: SIMPL domain-containing protein, partial [Sphingomonadales bacterium]|nr:SIMPL domain-containing protein [Sphingomonadales bacterium]